MLGIQVFQFFSFFAADVSAFAGQPLEFFLLCSLEEPESVQSVAKQYKKKYANDWGYYPNPNRSGMRELLIDDRVWVVHGDLQCTEFLVATSLQLRVGLVQENVLPFIEKLVCGRKIE